MISSVISTAVEKLISRSPQKKLEEVSKKMSKDQEVPGIQLGLAHLKEKLSKQDVKCFFCAKFNFSVQRHRPVDQGQPAMLDFASVQQMLQYTSAAQATDDLTPFLSESQKSPPLLLRGPVPASVWRLWRDVCVMVFDFAPMSLIIPSCVKFLYLLGGLIYHSNKPAKFRRAKHNSYPRKTWRFCRVFPIRTPRIHFICKTSWGSFEKLWWIETWKNFPGWYFYKLIEVRLSYF